MNRLPIALGVMAVGVVLGTLGYNMVQRAKQNQVATNKDVAEIKTQGSKAPKFLDAPAGTKDIRANATVPADPKTNPDVPPNNGSVTAGGSGLDLDEQARAQAWQVYYQNKAKLIEARQALEQNIFDKKTDPLNSQNSGNGNLLQPPPGLDNSESPPGSSPTPYSMGGVDPNGQTGKQAFLRTPGDVYGQNENMPGAVHGPKPMTIMEGTPLPCRLAEGATSDMPGQLNAEIMTNVYDSMTGEHLLIPQFTKLVTTYDIAISAGQDRMGVIGQRLIFPDTSSRQIGSVSIADQAGLAGLKDLRDTHFWERFGAALTVSIIGAGAQLSQPQQSAFATPSGTSAATSAMTQQLSQFGQSYAQRGLSIPDTLTLRPGLMCTVKMNKDLRLPEWHDAREPAAGDGYVSMTIGKFLK